MNQTLQQIYQGIIDGEDIVVSEKVQIAVDENIAPVEILNNGMISAMNEVGQRFEFGDYFIPEMLVSARAMQAGLAVLKPYLVEANVETAGRVVIATVKGDLHDIGKNLVSMMLEGAGFEVYDLGTNVTSERFVEKIESVNADILAMSALLTTTMENMKLIIKDIEDKGLRSNIKIMIGGAPVTEEYASTIGADGYASDAIRAVALARSLLNKSHNNTV